MWSWAKSKQLTFSLQGLQQGKTLHSKDAVNKQLVSFSYQVEDYRKYTDIGKV